MKFLKYLFDEKFFFYIGFVFFVLAFMSKEFLLLPIAFFSHLLAVLIHSYMSYDLIELPPNLIIISPDNVSGKKFLFKKNGFNIYQFIVYNGKKYEFFSDDYKIDLHTLDKNNYLILFPNIIYKIL